MRVLTDHAKKRAAAKELAAEEQVSLIGAPDGKRPARPPGSKAGRRRTKNGSSSNKSPPWTLTRLLKYFSMSAGMAVFTFLMLRKEQKDLHWEQYHTLLEPGTKEARCYADDSSGLQRCSCPDPAQPLARSGSMGKQWREHHNRMVWDAEHAHQNLDLVMLGDSITERWNGTSNNGQNRIDLGRRPFEKMFTKANGGTLEALSLGSAGDTGPNVLWHLQNGVLDPLNPKVWFLLIGTNDLFESECTDRFVIADILNVLKYIHMQRPEAQFIVHGILPRVDRGKKTQYLGKYWKRIQSINAVLKRFCETHQSLHYMQAGSVFLVDKDEMRGRKSIDPDLLGDGLHPTPKGLEVWGKEIIKMVDRTISEAKK